MTIYPFRALYPDTHRLPPLDVFCEDIKENFWNYRSSGLLIEDSRDALFIYDIETPARCYTGLACCLDLQDYTEGRILRHESTLPEKEQTIIELLLRRKAMIKPVLLTYQPNDTLTQYIAEARQNTAVWKAYHFQNERLIHRLYKVTDSQWIDRVSRLFKHELPKAFIADGHHRCKAGEEIYLKAGQFGMKNYAVERLLTVFFPFDQLEIHDYNRIVEVPGNTSSIEILDALSHYVQLEKLPGAQKPRRKHELTMYMSHDWYRLVWKPAILKRYRKDALVHDVDILNAGIIKNIFGIDDVREDQRIHYIEGISGLESLVDRTVENMHRVGFCLYPIEMHTLTRSAEMRKTLPPKSTWIEPRIKNGLISKMY